MATFTNQATLTYHGNTTNSNITYGEILDVLTAAKTAIEGSYRPGETVTYAVTLRNTGVSPLTNLALSDDLGGFTFGTETLYPLTYVDGSATLFINGILQPAPALTSGPPLVLTGLTIPAGSDAVLVYQALANEYANPATDSTIINTVTITGGGLSTPVTAEETVTSMAEPLLTITKSISPTQVVENDRVTYTFVIQNSGSEAVVATDDAAITDTFTPILTALAVTFNGLPWTEGIQYTYDESTGLFATVPGEITVPAATYTQDPVTGAYTVTPGIATLVITGTI